MAPLLLKMDGAEFRWSDSVGVYNLYKKNRLSYFLDGADFRINFIYVLYENVFVKIRNGFKFEIPPVAHSLATTTAQASSFLIARTNSVRDKPSVLTLHVCTSLS